MKEKGISEFLYKLLFLFNSIVLITSSFKDPKHAEVKVLRDRLVVLNETDQALAEIFKFNQELAEFDKLLTTLQGWCDGKAMVGHFIINNLLSIIFLIARRNSRLSALRLTLCFLQTRRRSAARCWSWRRTC